MPNDLVTSAWAPGLLGLLISDLMFGVSLAQSIHYIWYFSNDPRLIKLLVLLILTADVLHLIGTTQFYWALLVLCHRSDAAMCSTKLPWGAFIAVPMNYVVTVGVQCFYCQRIWIITGHKRRITAVVFFVAILQLALGTWASVETIKDGTIKYLYTTPLVPLAAGVSTLCDIIITITIFKHLWRSELRGRGNVMRGLVVVFINMGALTCLISLTVGVVYLAQGDHYWVGAPAVVISRCYVNSLLAVLNTRRRIRERESGQLRYTIEMPTIPTIH